MAAEGEAGAAKGAEVIVLGAGMVGVSAALALQAAGRAVTLVDRGQPGRETSYGNAGIIQAEAVEPYALPLSPLTLLRMGLKRDNALNYHLASMPGHLPGLLRYFWNSRTSRHRAISVTYRALAEGATAAHAPLIEAAGAGALIRREGFRQIYRTQDKLDAEIREVERLRRDYGVGATVLDGDALAAAEPNIKRRLAGAVQWNDAWTCSDPGGLTAAYAQLFAARGGALVSGDAASLTAEGAGWKVTTEHGPVSAPDVVVALGPWSPALLAGFGYRVSMVRKRGYHRHHRCEAGPVLPLMDADYSAVLSPMRLGLRVLTGAELASEGKPITPVQLLKAEAGAAELFDIGAPVENQPWTGVRPCLPDMLPMIGAAPRHKGLWFDFGHGHQGFTQGPVSAEVLVRAMAGERDPVLDALAPSPKRFA
ncbi:MAG: FAD-dependent oxidoreductase [Pseudomonadota bacterium]|nr:FAD-dependent oxidoreductase [Pseudomonadota bacterium]